MTSPPDIPSPNWSSTTKLVIGLTFAALLAGLFISFRSIIGPLILAFILTYLLHPLANRLSSHTPLSWRASVSILYIILIIILVGSSTLTGLAIVQQIQSLIVEVRGFLTNLPELLDSLSGQSLPIGPFAIDLSQFTDLSTLGDQLINLAQTLVSQAGSLVTSLASTTASTVGWGLFVLVISYFILADAGKVPDLSTYVDLPGYANDVRRMGQELGRIWNAFLRGQIMIMILVIISYTILLSILGVRFAFAIAIMAGLARFVPYIGPLITNLITALVTFFQDGNYFGMEPLYYMILVLVLAFLLDQIFDNLVSPRILGQSLGLHPAAVLVVAIISANLIGLVGLILAAPVLATLKLISRYTVRKMVDQDPWHEFEGEIKPVEFPWFGRLFRRLRAWWRARRIKKE